MVLMKKYQYLVKQWMLAIPSGPVHSFAADQQLGSKHPYLISPPPVRALDFSLALLSCGPVFPGYEESITSLVDMTYKLVHERLKGDACVTWAIAQRSNLPMKITLCVE